VEPWTFRPENKFLAADFRSNGGDFARHEAGSIAEMKRYIATGIDGFFTDDPALGRAASPDRHSREGGMTVTLTKLVSGCLVGKAAVRSIQACGTGFSRLRTPKKLTTSLPSLS
jgi:hypothetical protein